MVSFPLILILLSSTACILAAPENGKRETKEELCKKSCPDCTGSLSLLISIAHETNSEAMGLKLEKENMEAEKKYLDREIAALKSRIQNPSAPHVDLPPLSSGSVGIPETNFQYHLCNNCASLMSCLKTLGYAKDYWNSLEGMKTQYEADIKSLKAKTKRLTKSRDNLKKQLAKVLNNN